MQLIKINLLPYREALQQRSKYQFTRLILTTLFISFIAILLIYVFLMQQLSNQKIRNQILQNGINTLNTNLDKVNAIDKRKQDFLNRRNQISELNINRFTAAQILDSLNQVVPDNVYLTEFSPYLNNNDSSSPNIELAQFYHLNGIATNETQIAKLMQNLSKNSQFDHIELTNIQQNSSVKNFSIKLRLAANTQSEP